jgi:hypothetical protein
VIGAVDPAALAAHDNAPGATPLLRLRLRLLRGDANEGCQGKHARSHSARSSFVVHGCFSRFRRQPMDLPSSYNSNFPNHSNINGLRSAAQDQQLSIKAS